MTVLTEQDRAIIRELAEQDMNVSSAARELGLSPESVRWTVSRIARVTGLDPRKFYDLCELLDLLREGRL